MSGTPGRLDRIAAAPMFAASIGFLACIAGLLHLEGAASLKICEWGLAILWSTFLIEAAAHLVVRPRDWRKSLGRALFPPFRLAASDRATGSSLWLPRLGWLNKDADLAARLERDFSLPMIAVALLVLPLIAIEHFWAAKIAGSSTLQTAVQLATAGIWLAFTVEFVVMISVVEKKLTYCKEHWIDLAVICLPLVAFLRAARVGRLARFLKLQQLTKMARAYRLRGTLMRLHRALLILEIVQRLTRPRPERRLAKLRERLREVEQEAADLRVEIDEIETLLAPPDGETARTLAA